MLIGWGVYLIDRGKFRGGPERNDLTNQPDRVATFLARLRLARALAFASLCLATILCAWIGWETLPYPLLAAVVVVGYGRPRGARAKDVPLVKNLVVAGGLAGLAAGLSGIALRVGQPLPAGAADWAAVVLVLGAVTADAVVCDLDDIVGDRLANTRTIPVLLGPRLAAVVASVIACGTALVAWWISSDTNAARVVWLLAWPGSTVVLATVGAMRARGGHMGVRVRNLTDARLAVIALAAVWVAGSV